MTDDLLAPHSALSSVVYHRLRTAIIECRYPAGERLLERDIAIEFDVSRVPVREALPRLETAGFVRLEPRKGAVVTFITRQDVEELYDLRSVIEPLASVAAARNIAAGADDSALHLALAEATDALNRGDSTSLDTANAALHHAIAELAASELLTRTLAPLKDRTDRLSAVTIHAAPEVKHREHQLLVQAITSGNTDVAKAIAFAHVEFGRERTMASLPDHPHFGA